MDQLILEKNTALDVHSIISRISKLNKKEKLHILNILKTHQENYTKNAYGYFFNLTTIDDDVLEKVCKCLDLIEKNRDLIWEMDKRRDEVLVYYKSLIEEKLKDTIADNYSKYISMLRVHPINSTITISHRRVKKIRRRVQHDENVDPDVLMKEHLKSKKYPKNSVYHRIMTNCRTARSNRVSRKKEKDDDGHNNDSNDGLSEVESEEIGGDLSDNDGSSLKDDIVSDSVDNDSDNDFLSNADSNSIKNEGEEEEDNSIHEQSIDDQTEGGKQTARSSKKRDEQMSFYRRILNIKGFEFDKTNVLKREEYVV